MRAAAAAAVDVRRNATGCNLSRRGSPPLRLPLPPCAGTTLGVAALLVLGGIPLVLWFTAGVTMLVRRTAQTEMETFPFHAAKLEVTRLHWYLWGERACAAARVALGGRPVERAVIGRAGLCKAGWAVQGRLEAAAGDRTRAATFPRPAPALPAGALAAAALLVSAVAPGRPAQLAGWPLFLATAVLGYMLGMALPPRVQRWVHPILLCGALPSGAAALHGLLTGAGYLGTLDTLVRKVGA